MDVTTFDIVGAVNVTLSAGILWRLLSLSHRVGVWTGTTDTKLAEHGSRMDRIDRELDNLHGRISRVRDSLEG